MVDTYATYADLAAHLSSAYTAPDEAAGGKLLDRASELIDFVTGGNAQAVFDDVNTVDAILDSLMLATVAQVEYWMEVGEEHDVLGARGALTGGRVQIQQMPGALGPRARRQLIASGLLWAGVGSM